MSLKYITSTVDKLSPEIVKTLQNLNMRNMGKMYNAFKYASTIKPADTAVIYCSKKTSWFKTKIVGWVLILDLDYSNPNHQKIMVYVHKNHRRLGIGTELMNHAKIFLKQKKINQFYIEPWDTISENFFKKSSIIDKQQSYVSKWYCNVIGVL